MDDGPFEEFDDIRPFLFAGSHLDSTLVSGAGEPAEEDLASDTRDYLLTEGRTGGGRAGVKIETVVMASQAAGERGRTQGLSAESRAILNATLNGPAAVAEVATAVGISLGVARVLIGDLVADGLLIPSDSTTTLFKNLAFLERLLDGVDQL